MKIKKNEILNFLLIILSKIMLEYLYIVIVYRFYEYDGFIYVFDIEAYIIGWMVYLLGYVIITAKQNQFMYDIYLFLYLLYVLPNIIIYQYVFHALYALVILVIPYFVIVLFTFSSNNKIKYIRKGKPLILIISSISILTTLVHLVVSTNGHAVLNFNDVYVFREEYQDSFSGFFGYLNSWVFKFFITIVFAWSLQKKKIIYILLSVSSFFLLFTFSGHKSVFSGLILVLLFYYLYKSKYTSTLIVLSFFTLLLINIVFYWTSNDIFLQSLLTRRLLFLPSYLNYVYIDFFSINEYLWWSNSFMKSFVSNPYHQDLAFIIGEHLGHIGMDANTGFLASGFAQAGLIGIGIYTMLIILLFNIINMFANKIDKFIAMSIIFNVTTMTLFVSSDLLVSLLTHGLLIAIIVLYLYENKTYILKIGGIKYEI